MMLTTSLAWLSAICAPQAPVKAPTFTLSGRVVDVRGEGIPVVSIEIGGRGQGKPITRTTSDGEGYFRVGGLIQDRTMRAHASGDGYCRTSKHVTRNGEPMHIVLSEAITLRGIIRNRAQEPVAKIEVFASGRAVLNSATARTRTNAEGQFELSGVPLGACSVGAWIPKEGLLVTSLHATCDAEIQLTPTSADLTSLSVTLAGLAEEDLHRVNVCVQGGELGDPRDLPEPLLMPSMKSATWSVDKLPDWRFLIWPEADGIKFRPNIITVEQGTGPHQLVFTARTPPKETISINGIVRGKSGDPVAELPLTIYCDTAKPVRLTTDQHGKFTSQLHQADGKVASIYVNDGRWLLRPNSRAGRARESVRRTLHTDQLLDLRVIRSSSVTGRVLDADGRPAAYVKVALQRHASDRWVSERSATTDRNGEFRCPGVDRNGTRQRLLIASSRGHAAHEWAAQPRDLRTLHVGEIRLTAPATVHGTVTLPDNSPAIGFVVHLKQHERGPSLQYAITDSKGRYQFLGVTAAAITVQVRQPGFACPPMDRAELRAGEKHQHNLHLSAK